MVNPSRIAFLPLCLALLLTGCKAKPDAIEGLDVQQSALEADNRIRQIEAAARVLSVPLYPGWEPSKTREAYQFRENIDGRRYWLLLRTKDGAESVASFYKQGLSLFERRVGSKVQLEGTTTTGARVTVDFGRDGYGYTEFMVIGTIPNTIVNPPDVTSTVSPMPETPVSEPSTTDPRPQPTPMGGTGRIEPEPEPVQVPPVRQPWDEEPPAEEPAIEEPPVAPPPGEPPL